VVNEIVRVLSLYTGSEHSPEQVLVRLGLLRLTGCTTYKWKLSRPALLPIIFKLAIQMAASESQDCVGSSNGPEHS